MRETTVNDLSDLGEFFSCQFPDLFFCNCPSFVALLVDLSQRQRGVIKNKQAQVMDSWQVSIRQRPHCDDEIENAVLFIVLWFELPSTLIRHENELSKTLFKLRNKTSAFRFRVDGKHFENGAFRNDDVMIIT